MEGGLRGKPSLGEWQCQTSPEAIMVRSLFPRKAFAKIRVVELNIDARIVCPCESELVPALSQRKVYHEAQVNSCG